MAHLERNYKYNNYIPEFDKSVNFAATSAPPPSRHWLRMSRRACPIIPREVSRRRRRVGIVEYVQTGL